jgi:hypothetical protein
VPAVLGEFDYVWLSVERVADVPASKAFRRHRL